MRHLQRALALLFVLCLVPVAGACTVTCGTSCSGACVDTETDDANCGGCGMKCAAGAACSGGACAITCGAGLMACNGACTSTKDDPANCGACAMACAGGEACKAGVCIAAAKLWTVVPSANQAGVDTCELDSVACTSASFCVSVGYCRASMWPQTLIEVWNGSAWSIVPSPNPGAVGNSLQSVACSSPSACVAVGSAADGQTPETLVEAWDGSSWSVVPSPSPGAFGSSLNAVSCTSPSFCIAVGTNTVSASPTFEQLIEAWDGSSWSVISSPTQFSNGGSVGSVACTSPSACTAVGTYSVGSSGLSLDLIERWNGTSWSPAPSPSTGPQPMEGLNGVTCPSPTSCVVVGVSALGGVDQTHVVSWDGSAWSVLPSPSQDSNDNLLYGVACATPSSCVAVGEYFVGQDSLTLTETWDGTLWSLAPSPSPGTVINRLNAVACPSASWCVAVGSASNGTVGEALVEIYQ